MSEDRRPIGYTITRYWCRNCAPEGVRDFREPLRVGDDHGVPYYCDDCDGELLPCDHDFSGRDGEWRLAFTPEGDPPREIRFCAKCGDAEYRPAPPRLSAASDHDPAPPPFPVPSPDRSGAS
jgi:hypothetical protein